MNGERGVLARSSAHTEILVAGLNHLERCPIIPRRVLEEQGAKRSQLALQLWFGVGQTVHFQAVHGFEQVHVLVVAQKDVFALERARRAARFATLAREAESAMTDSVVGVGLLLGNSVAGLDGLESLDELRGGRGLDELHEMLAGVDGLSGFGFFLEGLVASIFWRLRKKGVPPSFLVFFELF